MINQQHPFKILVLTSTFPRWCEDTTPAFVFELTKRIKNLHEIIVLAPHIKGAKTHEFMEGVEIIRFRYFFEFAETLAYGDGIVNNLKKNIFKYFLTPFFLLAQLIAIIKIHNQRKVDIIHAHWLIPQGMIAAMAILFFKIKPALVCTVHGSDLKLPPFIFNPIYKLIFRIASAVVVVSHSLKQQAMRIGAPSAKLIIIPMGVDTEKEFVVRENKSKANNKLLFVGRLVKNKGLHVLLHALTEVVEIFNDVLLIIVGEGSEKAFLQALTFQLNLENHVIFVGARNHQSLPSFYQDAAIFVSPTLAEGFGLTLVEALACGCPVIVSDLPEVRDIILNQETGLTFTAGDSHQLANHIISLLNNPSLCRTLAVAGREKVVGIASWNRVVSQYTSLFETICAQKDYSGG